MDSFYSMTGSSPPQWPRDFAARHDVGFEEHERPPRLPEELVEALATLLAEALINDIREYPDLGDLFPASAPVAADGADSSPRQSARHPRTSAKSRTRRPAHAS